MRSRLSDVACRGLCRVGAVVCWAIPIKRMQRSTRRRRWPWRPEHLLARGLRAFVPGVSSLGISAVRDGAPKHSRGLGHLATAEAVCRTMGRGRRPVVAGRWPVVSAGSLGRDGAQEQIAVRGLAVFGAPRGRGTPPFRCAGRARRGHRGRSGRGRCLRRLPKRLR